MAKKKKRGDIRPQGQMRQSQVVTTFGPGAMVDLPEHSVIIGGLDNWTGYRDRQIFEDRLASKVKTLLNMPSVDFFAPPADRDDPLAEITGITAWQFPAWFITYSLAPPGSDGGPRERAVGMGQEEIQGGPNPLRPGLHAWARERYRLASVCSRPW
jgi:hypothetical protein